MKAAMSPVERPNQGSSPAPDRSPLRERPSVERKKADDTEGGDCD